MSLVQLFKKKSKVDLFTTPSHCQKFFVYKKFGQFYKYDISETDAHNPQDALLLAQKKAARVYKTNSTHFLTNGSTSGIIGAVLACVEKNEKVLIWKDAHVCHANAVELAGGTPIHYAVKKDEEWGIFKSVKPQTIENELKTQKIKAVIVTSPNYEGVVSDISAISEICKKYGTSLIVDAAHGALHPFSDKLPTSAIYQGADFVVQSLHKTAGGLNPTALLHCNIDEADIEKALSKISTTSPSYPILATIEKNINYLNSQRGKKAILNLIENIEKLKKNLKNCSFYTGDATKILVKIEGFSGYELSKILFEKYKIEDEICNEKSVMLLTGIGTDSKKLKRLEHALKNIKCLK